MRKMIPATAVFVAGFSVMSLELLGSRLLAPFFGASALIWTNMIGVILVALALGAWLGGILVDRKPEAALVGRLFFAAGTWSILLASAGHWVLAALGSMPPAMGAPIAAFVLMAMPVFLLGAVSPTILRLAMHDVEHTGHVAGRLSAIGTVGSLAGTYLTGYVLLPRRSVTEILVGVGALLCLTAAALFRPTFFRAIGSSCLVVGLVLPAYVGSRLQAGHPFPSGYADVAVVEAPYRGNLSKMLRINTGIHAIASTAEPAKTVVDYVPAMRAAEAVVPDPKRVLTLGGGAFHYHRDVLMRHPDAEIDAIEIDPAVVEAARAEFGLGDDPRLHIHQQDVRPELKKLVPGYDILMSDVYTGESSMPWYLMTKESVAAYRGLLKPDGIFIANAIFPTAGSGSGERFREDFFATLKSSFAWTFGISLRNVGSDDIPSTVIVFAGNGTEPDHAAVVAAIRAETASAAPLEVAIKNTGRVWTDDFGTADYQAIAMYGEAEALVRD